MTTITSSTQSTVVQSTDNSIATIQNAGNLNLNDIMVLLQQVFQKMRNTMQDLGIAQNQNSFKMAKNAVEKKHEAREDTKHAAMVSSIAGIAGSSVGFAVGGVAQLRPGPSGHLSIDKAESLNKKIDNLIADNPLDTQLKRLIEQDKDALYLTPGRLELNPTSGRLMKGEAMDGLHKKVDEIYKGLTESDCQHTKLDKWVQGKHKEINGISDSLNKLHPDTYKSRLRDLSPGIMQATPGLGNALGGVATVSDTANATSSQIAGDYIKDSQASYDKQRDVDSNNMRMYSQKITETTRSLTELYGAMVNATNWK